jgi:diaminopimelate epimerase
LRFSKYHGAGNDFIHVDGMTETRDWSPLAIAMCERYTGAGADGLIVAEPSKHADIFMRVFNADGSEAEMCGNGMRTFAKYVIEEGLAQARGDRLHVETIAGDIHLTLVSAGEQIIGATVDMGPPRFIPSEIPVAVEANPPVIDLPVRLDSAAYPVTCVSMGNPHAVHFIDSSVADFPLRDVGPRIEHHALFPARVNFEVAQVLDRRHIQSRTWERGVGETQACGTGACAIMVAARLHGYVDDTVEINEPGGVLTLRWDGASNVILTGPAAFVYRGDWPD